LGISQTGGREVIPWPVLYEKAEYAESYARWRIEDTGGTITVFDGAEPRVITLSRGSSWLSPARR
jgi:hypothetical protein